MTVEKLWLDKYEDAGECCVYCAKNLLLDVDSFMCGQLDHLVPTKSGGTDVPENKVLACFVCNNLKGDFDPRSPGPASKEAMIRSARDFIFARRATKARDLLAYKVSLNKPNQPPEPTPPSVTPPADAGVAPAVVVAHL